MPYDALRLRGQVGLSSNLACLTVLAVLVGYAGGVFLLFRMAGSASGGRHMMSEAGVAWPMDCQVTRLSNGLGIALGSRRRREGTGRRASGSTDDAAVQR